MVLDSIRRFYSEMFLAEKKVADFILKNPQDVINMNISELAQASDTSDATVIRVCKHIGYSGYYQLKINLASEFGKQQVVDVDSIKTAPEDVVGFFDYVSTGIYDAAKHINMETFLKCIDSISHANTVYTVAWGNTGAIASDFAHRISRCGIKTFVSDIPEYMLRSINLGNEEDVLVAISHSGTSIHVIQTIEIARERGIKTILITNSVNSKAADIAEFVLSTEVKGQVFLDFGGASHIYEMLLVDAIIYFLLEKNEKCTQRSDRAEMILSQYKL
jgi:Transcriptional regulators